MTRDIELTQGLVALVDDADFEWLNAWKWYANKIRNIFYAMRNDGYRRTVYMHRVILAAQDGMEVDHIDGDGLNNTRANLRIASRAQNAANRTKQANNKSGYKGVIWHIGNRAWHAQIRVNGRSYHLGLFNTPEDAARAYDEAARENFGEFAQLNNPEGNT